MQKKIKGRIFAYGNNIDTDQIYPGRYLELVDPNEISQHCLEGVDKNFSKKVKKGDILVAGTNFGCGSSREHAPIALINAGVGLVIAESFARIFFRNATNLALPLIVCPNITKEVIDGDVLDVDLEKGTIFIERTEKVLYGEKISEYTMKILENGGIKPMFKKMLGKKPNKI
jgi:3-isopropylmalate/(R)-2-methylmalate dehydratase small subunit